MDDTFLSCEELEERLAALHETSLELVKEISIETLLERLASRACEQAAARHATVGILDEYGNLAQFITVGLNSKEPVRGGHPPRNLDLSDALMHSTKAIRTPDISGDSHSAGFPPDHSPAHSFLGIPIRLGETIYGQIYLTDKIGAPAFTEQDQQVIETLAAYAAAAIANARLYTQLVEHERMLNKRTENLALLNDLAVTATSSSEIDQVIDQSLTQVMDYLDIEVGEVYLRQGDSPILQLVHHCSKNYGALWKQNSFEVGEGIVGGVAQSGQPSVLMLPSQNKNELQESIKKSDLQQIACFPLPGHSTMMGVLCVATNHLQPFDDLQFQFLTSISSWIGTIIENIHLSTQQRRLAVLEERERIGMDLHDGIIQSIYAVGLTLKHARLLLKEDGDRASERIEQAIQGLDSAIRDIRAYILDLSPRQLYGDNLMQGIYRLVSEFRANTNVEVTLQGPKDELAELGDIHSIALFHICQETLANIAKHARASHVAVTVWTTENRALLEVTDDGRGFDVESTRLTLGHGLSNMQTRARNVSGDVEITSEKGAGTTVMVWVPLIKRA
ncbi:MAG: GAF domain-containing protein [Anaerolineaceae bacterium]|nr:GAF domain-containing protein [Anaerolineaceae bacterium]